MTRTHVWALEEERVDPHPNSKIAFSEELFHGRLAAYKGGISQWVKRQPKAFIKKESRLTGQLLGSTVVWRSAPGWRCSRQDPQSRLEQTEMSFGSSYTMRCKLLSLLCV